ncbi:DNA-directed RNA polymerase I subunit RPA43 [Bombyx mandarina]|uniref:DNA-directed RNA polymerase I subunit RPA43 n=1 Tax=Bombyx mandarina TaxID=7092 RepID=A0A6J2KSA4_BOMMA|nr:DNA-directed RNA polymerase I subunit RPA43 [Bombyx mandarina]
MSKIIKFDLRELKQLANDKNSCLVVKKITQNLALQPWCLGNIKESITNLLDYKVGKFDKELNGVLVSYKNPCILQNVGTIRNDNADIHFQVQADYFIFQPYIGAKLTGLVNKKCSTHLSVLVHRVFNVVIPQPTEEPGDKWIGSSVKEGQEVTFRIAALDLYGALPYIRGELDERSLKLENYEIDDDIEVSQPLSVPYVIFDKTKPSVK